MLNKIKNRILDKQNICALILLIIGITLFLIFRNSNIIFTINIILLLWIIYKAKVSFFSLKIILCNYILMAVFFEYNFDTSYGILHISDNLYYTEMNIIIFIYNFFMLIWLNNTTILELEKKQFNNKFELPKFAEYLFVGIAVLATIIALPTLPFQDNYDRFNAFLPGKAWNHVAMIALIFLMPNLKKSKLVKIVYIFVLFWFVSHYERVDAIGVILLIIVTLFQQYERKIKLKNVAALLIIGLAILFIMNAIGEIRAGNNPIDVGNLVKKLFVQNTSCDVAYVFNSAIEYRYSNPLLLGSTYKAYLTKAIPLLQTTETTDMILKEKYDTAGGDFFLDEPLMNFGMLGVIAYPIIEILIYYAILKKQSKYRFFLWSFLIMTVFRTTWYGLYYIEKGILYIIPIMYFILYFIERLTINCQ